MKYKKLHIVRHGQTEYNKLKLVQGSGIDEPINELGRQQAAAFYAQYKHHPFEKIFISNLIRTYQSVMGFINDGLPYQRLEGLNEISWGNKEGTSFSMESHGEYIRITNAWKNGDLDACIQDGESPRQVMARQKEAMSVIQSHEEHNLLICMHGRAMRILICWLLGYDLRYMDNFEHENLGLYELTYTGKLYRLDKVNDISHFERVKMLEESLVGG